MMVMIVMPPWCLLLCGGGGSTMETMEVVREKNGEKGMVESERPKKPTTQQSPMSPQPNSCADVRKKSYKLDNEAQRARWRGEDNLVEIRKNKREDNPLKKRREGQQSVSPTL
ncbi:hypothetical protein RHMOL_Rhmol02G0161300 [Rhododendron molle]|uniref:Uncharacterized protein n=1 Tax=Rhododendron molle TaxID=49168 RepID=A0ACC0PR42_RHOML|nr:hypothetical protein RHMOL_Rhmol02G0161300 [Rhododendron molle]